MKQDANGWRCTHAVNRRIHKEVKQNATLDARGTAPAELESRSLEFHQDKAVRFAAKRARIFDNGLQNRT